MSSAIYSSKTLDRLGLVTKFCYEMDLAAIIDKTLSTSQRIQGGYGYIFTAMLMNGLGLKGEHCIRILSYLKTSRFPVYWRGSKASLINDVTLGLCLVALYEQSFAICTRKSSKNRCTHQNYPVNSFI
jgi:hypothetical protein